VAHPRRAGRAVVEGAVMKCFMAVSQSGLRVPGGGDHLM
jgi:hypothetical protein